MILFESIHYQKVFIRIQRLSICKLMLQSPKNDRIKMIKSVYSQILMKKENYLK